MHRNIVTRFDPGGRALRMLRFAEVKAGGGISRPRAVLRAVHASGPVNVFGTCDIRRPYAFRPLACHVESLPMHVWQRSLSRYNMHVCLYSVRAPASPLHSCAALTEK